MVACNLDECRPIVITPVVGGVVASPAVDTMVFIVVIRDSSPLLTVLGTVISVVVARDSVMVLESRPTALSNSVIGDFLVDVTVFSTVDSIVNVDDFVVIMSVVGVEVFLVFFAVVSGSVVVMTFVGTAVLSNFVVVMGDTSSLLIVLGSVISIVVAGGSVMILESRPTVLSNFVVGDFLVDVTVFSSVFFIVDVDDFVVIMTVGVEVFLAVFAVVSDSVVIMIGTAVLSSFVVGDFMCVT